jgi:hypothetical protein
MIMLSFGMVCANITSMKGFKMISYCFIIVLFLSCQPANNQKSLEQKIDSLNNQLGEIQAKLDSTFYKMESQKSEGIKPKSKVEAIKQTSKPKPIIITPKPIENKRKPIEDTIYHYYKDGKISVKVSPRVDGRQAVFIYGKKGELHLQLESVFLSYSVSHDLRFRADGSLEKIKEHHNPGASMYWSECELTFSQWNMPQWKSCQQYPIRSLDDYNNNRYYWDVNNKTWVKQEIVREQNVPQNRSNQ